MVPQKQESGYQKRKRKKQVEEFVQTQRGSLDKYFVKKINVSVETHVEELANEHELEFVENELGVNENEETENNEHSYRIEDIADEPDCMESTLDLIF